jgi:hypothetical protein
LFQGINSVTSTLSPSFLSAADDAVDVPGGCLDWATGSDVVDSASDDEDGGASCAPFQPGGDLVGALTEAAAVTEAKARVLLRGPELPLAAHVVSEPKQSPHPVVGVVAGSASRHPIPDRCHQNLLGRI